MNKATKTSRKGKMTRLAVVGLVWALAITLFCLPWTRTEAAAANTRPIEQIYKRPVPIYDLNLDRHLQNVRQATGAQLAAVQSLKTAANAQNMQVRWNEFGGSPDVMYDFASQSFPGTPEQAGRAFLQQNAAAFGISDMSTLRLFDQKDALGGHMLRFQQTFGGIDVKDGGIGLVLNANNQVIMASGPFFRDVNVNTTPAISPAQAKTVVDTDINRFKANLPGAVNNLFQTANTILNQQLGAVNTEAPRLGIYPTADGYKLVWKVAKFSTNPFGVYLVMVDAHSGQIVARKDFVKFQAPNTTMTGDIFPKYPTITQELKDQSIISDCGGTPCGQERVTLRNFDESNRVTGVGGTLTGTHALVNNALAPRQPFAQAALGTWHFRQDNPTGFEARTNEQDHFAEPAEHQDEINAFFFVNYLLEYIDYIHVGGDNTAIGGGAFPDDYPNKTVPLPATVHMPNFYMALDIAGGNIPDPTDPNFRLKAQGMDNAFAVPVSALFSELTGVKMPVVVNPTFYGHGFYFNDLALEGSVPYHEGMHSITTPIAGLEGGEEASGMNEGQADMWAFTITDNPSLGDYVVNAKGYRDRARSLGRNPDSIAYIRSARSTLKFSDIGTLMDAGSPIFEEHYDGEIFMSTMWDIREMLNRVYPQNTTYKRPQPKDGLPQKPITRGTEIFERDFLGAMYVLGTIAPDTYVKSRDAMIVADQMLYPSDSADADAPGKHRAMIEQIFAGHEMGINAVEVTGGRATISTQVSYFAGNQAAPSVPENVQVIPASPRSLQVSWASVDGAVSYEVLKRKNGFANRREPNGKREYSDGDSSTTGFRHVAYVDGNRLSYEDKGAVHEVFAPEGLNDLYDSAYVVRAIGVNSTGQLGFSDLSGNVVPLKARQDLTAQVDSAISNISFSGGVMAFDNKITNARGALSIDKTIYQPIEFQIVSISNPTVTVRNADSGGNTFVYNQALAFGATSAAKRFEFNDPAAQIFTFDARVYGNAFAGTRTGLGGPGDGSSTPPVPVIYSVFRENKTGTLIAGEPTATGGSSLTWGDPAFKGITWEDIEVTTKSDALFLDATLSSATAVDLDFELRTADGQILSDSAGATAAEHVSSAVQPDTTYILRVKGFANGPSTFNIVSDQYLPNGSPNGNAGTTGGGSGSGGGGGPLGGLLSNIVRFTVNPLTKKVTFQILH